MEETKNAKKVLVIHGPNLNLLGTREPEIYGKTTLDEINSILEELGNKLGLAVETFQSNHEGAIVDKIQQAVSGQKGLIINPAAYTHTSIAIRDALVMLDIPVVTAQIKGFGVQGYTMALEALAGMIK